MHHVLEPYLCHASQARAIFCLLTVGVFALSGYGQESIVEQDPLWQPLSESSVAMRGERHLNPERYKTAAMNVGELKRIFSTAPTENSPAARAVRVTLTIPDPSGKLVRFYIEESTLLSPKIAAKFPSWRTYQGYGIDDPTATAKFDWTDAGFHGYVLSNSGSFSIDPIQTNDVENYIIFRKDEYGDRARLSCTVEDAEDAVLDLFGKANHISFFSDFTHGAQLRTYRLAVATTFEYTNFFRQTGDTDEQAQARAFAQVVTTVNRVDGVYRKELAVAFTLVSDTNLTYVVNPEVPANYNNNGSSADLTSNQTNVNSVIGVGNFDVGHLFETGNGGVAQLSSVCGSSSARGLSGLPNPTGDPFDVDYVAHELGHQFAANHTFNATSDCGSSPAAARKEPGSAVTMMGYAGICSSFSNVQRNSIETFHVHNLTESINFLTNGAGATCGTLEGTNAAPVVAELPNYTIPFNTPFVLTASATDADNDPLSYNWEQNNASAATSNYPATTDDDDISLVFRPGFRSYLPMAEPTRSFPSLRYILDNSNEAPISFVGTSTVGNICGGECITGEDLPSEARTMNFRVSVRDGRGGISDQGTVLTVVNTTTPFRVTTQNASTPWYGTEQRDITWAVSGTTGNGINVANVKISLSTDGGLTFPLLLADSTPNDGSHSITVPVLTTTQARIKIEAIGNIFFDINDVNFPISAELPSIVSVGGRAVTSGGLAIKDAQLAMTSMGGVTRIARTNSFGYYRFDDVAIGQDYVVSIASKRFTFTPESITVTVTAGLTGVDFVSAPGAAKIGTR